MSFLLLGVCYIVVTRLGKSQSLCAYRASPWIDLLAHTVLDEITEITHISVLHR